jgi:AraC family transcriptional regulator of arabinose operon
MFRGVYYDGNRLRWANRRTHTAKVVFGEVLYEPGGVCGPRVQRDFQLVLLHSGECQVSLNEAAHLDLKVGTLYLFLPGGREHFSFSADKETHHSWCAIRPGFMPEEFQPRLRQAPASAPCSEVFRLLLAAAFKLRTPRHRATACLVEQLGLCAFAEYLNASRLTGLETGQDPAVRAFLNHVDDHFAEEDCLHSAHLAAGISRNAMIYKFRKEMRETPARYLWRLRIERGAAMLGETGHTTAEIAYRCGFKNPFHFSRSVKQHFGCSPKDLRHRAWSAGTGRPADSLDPVAGLVTAGIQL